MNDSKGETAPALGISLSAQFAGGRTVVFQTHVPQDVPKVDLDNMMDTLNAVADRQEAFYAQEQARRQLEVEENALTNMTRRLGEVEGNMQLAATAEGRRNHKPSPKDEMQRKQALDTIEEGKKRVNIARKYLDELIKKAGNRDGAASTTDR